MVHKSNFIASIKCNGKILREFKDSEHFIKLPFGSEYSILLKNLDSRSAVVSVSIDGKDVLDNTRLIIRSNEELELEGFKKGKKISNKFKFIEKTDSISEFRGDRIDDGIIRIEYTFEKFVSKINYVTDNWYVYEPHVYEPHCPYCWEHIPWSFTGSDTTNITFTANMLHTTVPLYTIVCNNTSILNKSDEGITVKGSDDVDQSFVTGYTKDLEDMSNVITIKLVGYNRKGKIEKPITVRTRLTCETCGKKNRSYKKYCSNCGTFLQ